jgi:hypothetical protein
VSGKETDLEEKLGFDTKHPFEDHSEDETGHVAEAD